MNAIIAFSSNLKLDFLFKLKSFNEKFEKIIIVTSQKLLENERLQIGTLFPGCRYISFGELLSDAENEECDRLAFNYCNGNAGLYMLQLNAIKNEKIITKIIRKYHNNTQGFLLSDDLGFIKNVWINHGFQYIVGEYYYDPKQVNVNKRTEDFKFVDKKLPFDEVHVAKQNGMLYVFLGKMKRVSDYIDLEFAESEEIKDSLNRGQFIVKGKCQYLTTIHEHNNFPIPDDEVIDVRYVQDGYLPPNYSADSGMKFHQRNVSFYALDPIGLLAFNNGGEKAEILPFAKKIFMPLPDFPQKISTILIASTCAGSWSAQINRSDDDILTEAIALIARTFPDIKFIYRCHPTCVHPEHAGVNSIIRIANYFDYMGLKNVYMSSNIPNQDLNLFDLSFGSSSLLEDIKQADLVIGEYSHSLIEAAMERKLFSSVNLTNRRNFYECITDFGFPHCRSAVDLAQLIRMVNTNNFKISYNKAIDFYNRMIETGVI